MRETEENEWSVPIALGFVGDLDDDDLDVKIREALWAATSNASFGVKLESFCAMGRVGRRPG